MKHETTTMNTKKALAASLKKAVEAKPFSRVTVSEIIQDCGVNRKTFYYHFQDVYDLLKWMLEQEAVEVVRQFDLLAEYEEAIRFVMDYVEENRNFLRNIYDSLGREELKRFFYHDFVSVVQVFVREAERQQGSTVPEDYKRFLVAFYTEALAGTLLEWIVCHESQDREKTVQYISAVMRTTIPSALAAAAGK